jgi:NAD+ diphosphatase
MDDRSRDHKGGFAARSVDRVAAKRLDEAWLEARLAHPDSRFVPLWRDKNLVDGEAKPVASFLSRAQVNGLLDEAHSITFLGLRDDRPYFALDLADGMPEDSPPPELREHGEFRDLRRVGALLDADEGALLAYARAMAYWHRRHRFCGECGCTTESDRGGHLRVCTRSSCGAYHFPRTDPAIIVLVHTEETLPPERCLLGRQPAWPEGLYSTIAGFVEPGETLEEAVAREVREETGVPLREVRYRSSQPWPFPSSLMLAFVARAAGEGL